MAFEIVVPFCFSKLALLEDCSQTVRRTSMVINRLRTVRALHGCCTRQVGSQLQYGSTKADLDEVSPSPPALPSPCALISTELLIPKLKALYYQSRSKCKVAIPGDEDPVQGGLWTNFGPHQHSFDHVFYNVNTFS